MHEINYELINCAEQKAENKRHLRDILNKYRLACKLSNGPDLSRSKYWASEARSIERKIVKILNSRKIDCCE